MEIAAKGYLVRGLAYRLRTATAADTEALALYEGQDFVIEGRLRDDKKLSDGTYHGTYHDTLVMERIALRDGQQERRTTAGGKEWITSNRSGPLCPATNRKPPTGS